MRDRIQRMSLTDGASVPINREEVTDVVEKIADVVEDESGEYKPGRRLFLDANGKVVENDSPDKLTLLVSEFGSIPMARARELGLMNEPEVEAKPKAQTKAQTKAQEAAPETKAIESPPETKSVKAPRKARAVKGKK